MIARKLSDEERVDALAICDFYRGERPRTAVDSKVASGAAHSAMNTSLMRVAESYPWDGAAALLRCGWSPGEVPTSAQLLSAAAAVALHILAETGADVTIRCDVTPAVGAAMSGPVTATYTITATGDAP